MKKGKKDYDFTKKKNRQNGQIKVTSFYLVLTQQHIQYGKYYKTRSRYFCKILFWTPCISRNIGFLTNRAGRNEIITTRGIILTQVAEAIGQESYSYEF